MKKHRTNLNACSQVHQLDMEEMESAKIGNHRINAAATSELRLSLLNLLYFNSFNSCKYEISCGTILSSITYMVHKKNLVTGNLFF